jgi:hypothetical protein
VIKKIIFKIAFGAVVLFILDFAIGRTLRYFYFNETSGLLYRTTFSIDSTTAEILIFGSSRANHHYVPEIFEEGLKMSFYNCGRDGTTILYSYAVFRIILRRYTPKIIILDVNREDFYYDPVSYERLSFLLPYYSIHPEIRSIINLRGPYEKVKLLSAIYPFNSLLISIGIGNLNINKNRYTDQKGYIPLLEKMNETDLKPFKNNVGSIDANKLQALDSVSELCFKKGIKLFICYSPIYVRTQKTNIDTLISKIVDEHNFKYFNFSNDTVFISRPNLFRDKNHLNNDGAIYYSSLVRDSIKFYIDKYHR